MTTEACAWPRPIASSTATAVALIACFMRRLSCRWVRRGQQRVAPLLPGRLRLLVSDGVGRAGIGCAGGGGTGGVVLHDVVQLRHTRGQGNRLGVLLGRIGASLDHRTVTVLDLD